MFEMILFGLVVLCGTTILLCKYAIKAVPIGKSQPRYITEHEVEPWYLDYARSFFPVLLIVFLLRGFIAEPFRIPSGSMLPTLEVGDFILVNKFHYGIRIPILHTKIVQNNNPQRGDIMVFRFPRDNVTHYIKRVIGLPGDVIEYRQKRLSINGQVLDRQPDGDYLPLTNRGFGSIVDRYTQSIKTGLAEPMETEFSILMDPGRKSRSVRLTVPEGHYFMMGDNRDNSLDSRSWGFVPEKNIVGKAFFVWFHWFNHPDGGLKLSRVGADI